MGTKVIIQAKSEVGFWRCGQYHPAVPTEHDVSEYTAEELARLQAEPKLSVRVLADEGESLADSPAKKPAKKRKG